MYGVLFMWFLLYLCYLYSFTDTDDQHDVHITLRPNQIMFVSFNRNTACVTRGTGTGTSYEREGSVGTLVRRAKKAHVYLRRANLTSNT